MRPFIRAGALLALMAGGVGQAQAGLFTTYGDATYTAGPASDPVVLQLTSDPTGIGYAGLEYKVTSGTLTLNTLTQLSADYEMTTGTFGGGSPRFTIFDQSLKSGYIYFGTPVGGGTFTDPTPGQFANTGNYADPASTDARVALNGFGGVGNGNTYETYAQAQAQVGNTSISYITLDLDGGFTPALEQIMITDHFTINGDVFNAGAAAAPEPSTWILAGTAGVIGLGYGWRRRRKAGVA